MAKLKISLKPAIKKLEIVTRGLVKSHFVGAYKSGFKGRGLEFRDYKQYAKGDDANRIDWKATMRTNEILVKNYEEERQLNVALLIDVSSSMVYGTTQKLKNEYAAEVAVSLAFAVLQVEDSLGFAIFSDKVKKIIYPNTNKNRFYLLSKLLVDINSYGGGYDLGKALKVSLAFFKPYSLLIIISDFIGLKGDWEKNLRITAKKFDVIGIMIRDPRDRALPKTGNQVIVQDPFSGKQMVVKPDVLGEAFKRHVKRDEKLLANLFASMGGDFVSLSTDEDFVRPLLDFFRRRVKRWR